MKRLLTVLLFSNLLILSACQSDNAETATSEEEIGHQDEVEESFEQEEKETKPIEEIKEQTLYSWEIEDEGTLLKLYLIKEDGTTTTIKETSALGVEGERQYTGSASFYVVVENGQHGYLEEKFEKVDLNLDRAFSPAYPFGQETMIAFVQPEATNMNTLTMWRYHAGKLESVHFDDKEAIIISNHQMKFIHDAYLQTYVYNNGSDEANGVGWIYTTWKWDQSTKQFLVHDVTKYTNETEYGWDTGEIVTKSWHEHEKQYVLFPEMTITDEIIDAIKQGKLFNESIHIGQSIDEVLSEMPAYTAHEYYEGGPFYSFPGPSSYFYDEVTRVVTGITLAGSSITNDLQSIKSILGEPDEEGFDEMEQVDYLFYYIDDYLLRVNYESTGEVDGLWLLKKN